MRLFALTSILFASLFSISSIAGAASTKAPDFSVSGKTSGSKLEIHATAPQGHHFNLKAPMSVTGDGSTAPVRPSKASEKEVVFSLPNTNAHYSVSLFLCDDALTFCEKKTMPFESKGGSAPSANAPQAAQTVAEPDAQPTPAVVHGFIVNDAALAFNEAKKSGKPVMIDFFGIWCPPCNLLDEKVFSTKDFQKKSSNFVKLKMDVDKPTAWDLVARYQVHGYPTVVFASPEGDEISRIVGFRPGKEFVETMSSAYRNRTQAFSALLKKADAGDVAAAEQVGTTYLARSEFEKAIPYLEKSPKTREKLWDAKINAAQSATAEKKIELYEKAIEEFPKTPDAVQRRMDLADLLTETKQKDRAKAVREQTLPVIEALIAHPESLKSYDATVQDMWIAQGQIYEALEQKNKATSAYQSAAKEIRKDTHSDTERGHGLELAYCLFKSGDLAGAEAVYTKLQKAYPNDFTFYQNHASMLFKSGKYDEARKLVEQALAHAYGSNRMVSTLLFAKISNAQGKKQEALSTLQQAIEREKNLPADAAVRSNAMLKRLKDLEKEIRESKT